MPGLIRFVVRMSRFLTISGRQIKRRTSWLTKVTHVVLSIVGLNFLTFPSFPSFERIDILGFGPILGTSLVFLSCFKQKKR